MQSRVWYSKEVDLTSPDSIHQTFAYGSLEDIRSLKKTVGIPRLQKIFLQHPKKVYTVQTLHFIKHIILGISSFDEQQYLKSTPRHTR